MNVREIKEIVRHYHLGISPRRMGQHFLVNPKVLERIAQVVGPKAGDRVVEIGAGLGALTDVLVASGGHVHAVEKDPRFVQVLTDRFRSASNLEIIPSDFLVLELSSYAQRKPKGLLVAGNIPYSMTAKILEYLLRQRQWIGRAVLTLQKEVAERIVAQPGTKAYSSISILVGVAFKPSIAFHISPGAFYPQPKVTSSVLRLDPLAAPVIPSEEEEAVLKLTRRLFLHRRKTLLNSLDLAGMQVEKQELKKLFEVIGLDPSRRPETLDLKEIHHLCQGLKKLG